MAARQMKTPTASREDVDPRVVKGVAHVLAGKRLIAPASVDLAAQLAGTAAAVVDSLPDEARRRLIDRQGQLIAQFRGLLESFGRGGPIAKIELNSPQTAEKRKGSGLGEILSREEGLQALSDKAVTLPIEDWAGPIAGPMELERELGIARSSLHRWHQNGDAIGFLKGTHRHAYPIEQFVDGRPAKGLAEVTAIVPNQKVAWFWLSRSNPVLGKRPVDMLKQDRVTEVLEAARAYFQQP